MDIDDAFCQIQSYFQEICEPYPKYATKSDLPNAHLVDHISRMMHTFEENKMKFLLSLENDTKVRIDHNLLHLIIKSTILIHDVGKINPFFQYQMRGDGQIRIYKKWTFHSMPSAIIGFLFGLTLQNDLFKNSSNTEITPFIPYILMISIQNHHNKILTPINHNSSIISFLHPIDENIIPDEVIIFTYFFDYLSKSLFFDDLTFLLEKDNQNTYLLNMWEKFSSLFQTSYKKFSESPIQIRYELLKHIFEKMRDIENNLCKISLEQRKIIFFLTTYICSILDNLDTWDAMTSRTKNARLKLIKFDINRKDHNAAEIIIPFINKVKKPSPLNFERNRLSEQIITFANGLNFQEINKNRGKIYSITAPCGIGKTLSILYLAFKLQTLIKDSTGQVPKIIYSLPFISICDQVEEIVKEMLNLSNKAQSHTVTTHHHLANFGISVKKIQKKSQDQNYDSDEEYFADEMTDYEIDLWRSDIIITSSVRLFETLFKYSKNNLLRFNRLVNSIIILDEYHCLPLQYHDLIHQTLLILTKYFNTQIIIATATTSAIFSSEDLIEIIPNQVEFFRNINRYLINYSPEPKSEQEFNDWILKIVNLEENRQKSIMVVLNKTYRSRAVFLHLKPRINPQSRPIYHLSGKITPLDRKIKLKKIRNDLDQNQALILITTQLIEAGIDVSFNYVIRDIGPLSSIIQVAGRCNRNAEMQPIPTIEIVRIEDDASIYDKGSLQITANFFKQLISSSNSGKIDEVLLRKNYFEYANLLRNHTNKSEGMDALQKLNYDQLTREFKMIKERNETNLIIFSNQEEANIFKKKLQDGINLSQEILNRTITLTKSEVNQILQKISNLWAMSEDRQIFEGNSLRTLIDRNELLFLALALPCPYYDSEIGLKLEKNQE